MKKLLAGKTAVVNGSGKRSGIGYAVARKLAAEGANLVIADLGLNADPELAVKTGDESEMADIAREIARNYAVETMAVNLDVTRPDSVARMVKTIAGRFDAVHILVNNAGAAFGVPNAVHTYDGRAWMKTIDVNLHGVFRVSRAVLPMMIQGGGGDRQHRLPGRQGAGPVQRRLRRGQGRRDHAHQGHGRGIGRQWCAGQRHLPGTDCHGPRKMALRFGSTVLRFDYRRKRERNVQDHSFLRCLSTMPWR